METKYLIFKPYDKKFIKNNITYHIRDYEVLCNNKTITCSSMKDILTLIHLDDVHIRIVIARYVGVDTRTLQIYECKKLIFDEDEDELYES